MRAVVISTFGGPEVLRVQNVPTPQPGPGQVAIKVAYAGVNYAEIMIRRGGHGQSLLPNVPGLEVSGHIIALGDGVEGLRIGQPVAAFTGSGGYAEVALAPSVFTFPLDTNGASIDLAMAAGFPTIVPTVYDMLVHSARLRKGETILVHAAAGGVGIIAGQMARYLGAGLIIGTVSSPAKARYAQDFGYDHLILREQYQERIREITNNRGLDIVLDGLGEPVRSQSFALLAPFGRLVIYGNASNDSSKAIDFPAEPGDFLSENKAVIGYSIGTLARTASHLLINTARESLKLVAEKHIQIDITAVLPLEQAAEAHQRLETRATVGKTVLKLY